MFHFRYILEYAIQSTIRKNYYYDWILKKSLADIFISEQNS